MKKSEMTVTGMRDLLLDFCLTDEEAEEIKEMTEIQVIQKFILYKNLGIIHISEIQ